MPRELTQPCCCGAYGSVKVDISYASWATWWDTTHPGQPLGTPPNKQVNLTPGAALRGWLHMGLRPAQITRSVRRLSHRWKHDRHGPKCCPISSFRRHPQSVVRLPGPD